MPAVSGLNPSSLLIASKITNHTENGMALTIDGSHVENVALQLNSKVQRRQLNVGWSDTTGALVPKTQRASQGICGNDARGWCSGGLKVATQVLTTGVAKVDVSPGHNAANRERHAIEGHTGEANVSMPGRARSMWHCFTSWRVFEFLGFLIPRGCSVEEQSKSDWSWQGQTWEGKL